MTPVKSNEAYSCQLMSFVSSNDRQRTAASDADSTGACSPVCDVGLTDRFTGSEDFLLEIAIVMSGWLATI